uniref:Nitric oxide synthase-interacting protein zinc-finger domain-containing protein n=1 Tax=Equus caballus TaxID=9796 RepID=A0A9L0S3N2_HORSE
LTRTMQGKNCTAGTVYTWHERKKDTVASGHETQNIRLSPDAVKDFDCSCLSTQPCHDPLWMPSLTPRPRPSSCRSWGVRGMVAAAQVRT